MRVLFCCVAAMLLIVTEPAAGGIPCDQAEPGQPCCGDGEVLVGEPPVGEACDDGNNIDGDGCNRFCLRECTIHNDCLQGEFCYQGVCLADEVPVYHCEKAGCPPGKRCIDAETQKFARCPEDQNYVCETACDCGPAHACMDIPNVGLRCVKDVDDPYLPGGTAIYGVIVPPGEPTYCCTDSSCYVGRNAYGEAADEFRCYEPQSGEVSEYCGGRPCYYVGDCEPGEACIDTRTQQPIPGASCSPEGGRCESNAVAEVVFGYRPSELFTDCAAQPFPSGTPGFCEQGWRPGGSVAVQRVLRNRDPDACGDGTCGVGEYPDTCQADCFCGDGVCAPSEVEVCVTDCGVCGDGVCGQLESPKTCAQDCTVTCGDDSCDASEVTACPEDCLCGPASVGFDDYPSVCGDGLCQSEGSLPENCLTCASDCGPPADEDGDGVADCVDNCTGIANGDQSDFDQDGQGDLCDDDDDNDGLPDDDDPNPLNPDSDDDGVLDGEDNCVLTPNTGQSDFDGDGEGDACDADDDNDSVADSADVCPQTVIPEHEFGHLKPNRWALLNTSGDFTQAPPQAGSKHQITITDTRGCSCEQIADALELGISHYRDGCSTSVLLKWIDGPD